jgi:NitT/TauT family transport system substrate-binding protein
MSHQHARQFSRRRFLGGVTLAGTAGLLGLHARRVAAEPPPETTRLRLAHHPAICTAPYFLAKEFLPAEGFTDVQDVKMESGWSFKAMVAREIDIALNFSGPLITRVDAGDPLVILAGIHVGCFQLFGGARVRAIRDLKGKTVALFNDLGGPEHVFLASMAAHVGLDPRTDIRWVTHPFEESTQLFVEGQVDAVLAFPPQAQELRARQLGQVVVNSLVDRPWSQYFCCMAYAHREFVRTHPVAIKRALRAILKAAAICSLEPERVARFLVDGGYTKTYAYALETMQDVGYNGWREYDAEDTIRFYALRLHEAGMIKSSPQKVIAQGTDWRAINELKKELKG